MKTTFKKLTAATSLLLTCAFAFTVAGCSNKGGSETSGGAGIFAPMGGYDSPDGAGGDDAGIFEPSGSGDKKPNGWQTAIVKQLTCAEWNDSLNYDFWLGLFEEGIEGDGQENQEQQSRGGIFSDYAKAPRGLDAFEMHEVFVTSNGSPVVNAAVNLYAENATVYSAVTDSTGRALVFGNGTRVEAASGGFSASADVTEGVTNIELTDCGGHDSEMEIMLVVDTTGSMGDELSFLCDELAGVITRASAALDCKIRLGLTFYRDKGDDYLTRTFDFCNVTSSNGLNTAVNNIKAQKSDGGGDYPEAVDAALGEAVAADWHKDSKTKLLFHILDAPYHDEQENQSAFSAAVKSAASKGIRIIPVAASGLSELGQYIMRSAALLTGGTYAFLTDDSGIGDSHELPAVGKYTVEYLSDLMVRLIKGYYTGTFEEPVLWTQSESVA